MSLTFGTRVVYGVPPEMKPIEGIPAGAKVRVRFRNDNFAKVFYRLEGSTARGAIKIIDDRWVFMEQGRNQSE